MRVRGSGRPGSRAYSPKAEDDAAKATIARADEAITEVKNLVAAANSEQGTLGKLLKDNSLYNDINHTVNSADSLLIDLKANPKRYVHFSLWGNNDKEKDKKK